MDILDITNGVIIHQVNCRGVMGAGLALQIRNKYPIVYKRYIYACQMLKQSELLGCIQPIQVTDSLTIVNCFSQLDYGRDKCHTNYKALKACLHKVNALKRGTIYVPYRIGCGLAGGDWDVVSKMLINELNDYVVVNRTGGE